MRLKPVLIIIALITLSGCSQPHLQANLPQIQRASGYSWAEAIEVTTEHYRIVTNSDQITASEIGTVLETVYAACENILGPAQETPDLLSVYAFTSRRLYQEQIASLNLPTGISSGMYTPSGAPGIYLPLVDTNKTHPFFTLVHEGLHQYLQEAQGVAIRGTTAKLPATPLWLSEGLALYLEAALVDTGQLQPGRLHPSRLKHLQGLLKSGKAPEIKQVVRATYGEPFSNADYSVAWGLVYALRHSASSGSDWAGYWTALQAASKRAAREITAKATDSSQLTLLAMQQQWAQQLGQLSEQVFQEQVIKSPGGWAEWEERWRVTMLQTTWEQ